MAKRTLASANADTTAAAQPVPAPEAIVPAVEVAPVPVAEAAPAVDIVAVFDKLLLARAHAKWGNPAHMEPGELRQRLAELVDSQAGEFGNDAPEIVMARQVLAH